MKKVEDRIKDLQFVYQYSDFSIFCAEVTDMFKFIMPLGETVEFRHGMWYYSATFYFEGGEQLKFVICDEGFTKHQLFHKKRFSSWKQLFDTKDYQGANCMNSLHEVLTYYRIQLQALKDLQKQHNHV